MKTLKHDTEELIILVLAITVPIAVVYLMVGILTMLQHIHL